MSTAFRVLLATTLLCAVWCAFVYAIFPIGPVDGLYATVRPKLVEAVGEPDAGRMTAEIGGEVASGIEAGISAVAAPLLLNAAAWAALAYRLLRSHGRDPWAAERPEGLG